MFADDNDIEYLDDDEKVFNERLEREGGVFVEPQPGQVDCNTQNGCAPDDYPEDPYAIDNRPGTVDDIGYGMGLTTRDANDHTLIPDVRTRQVGPGAPDVERECDPGTVDERDLWRSQEALIEEDEDDGIKLPAGMGDEDGERILAAMGDDTGDAVPEGVEGSSATGEPTSTPDHGGFPEREG